jgi:hypothetical protein
MGIAFCCVAFSAGLIITWRSLVAGLVAVLTVGYLFGIVRANFLDSFSHFIFDAVVLGFFLTLFCGGMRKKGLTSDQQQLKRWVWALLGWAGVMFLVPMQHPLIQLVGLRGNAFLIPFLVVGSRLERKDAIHLGLWLSVLNHLAFVFAVAEFILGVPAFFPENAVTEIVYNSNDVAGYTAHRIPSCFSNAHIFGGTMVTTLPWLLGAWVQPQLPIAKRCLLASGMASAMLGVFMCAARTPLLLLGVIIVLTTCSGKLRGTLWLGWAIVLGGLGYVVSGEERLQRFTTLQDTHYVITRFEGSVNMNFLELLLTYPLGNGMGAGGTSIPFFLQHLLQEPVGLENEYSRILLEQGLVGLALWLGFVLWYIGRRPTEKCDPWQFGKFLLWFHGIVSFASALTGMGLMTSIPQSMLFFLGVGFCTTNRHWYEKKKNGLPKPHFRLIGVLSEVTRTRRHSPSRSK